MVTSLASKVRQAELILLDFAYYYMYIRAYLITNVSEQFWMSKFRFSVPKLVELDPHIAYVENCENPIYTYIYYIHIYTIYIY